MNPAIYFLAIQCFCGGFQVALILKAIESNNALSVFVSSIGLLWAILFGAVAFFSIRLDYKTLNDH